MLLILLPIATAEAECNKVVVANFNYNEGVITYKDRVIKCGYAPDRRLQPSEGYTAEVLSTDNRALYSFKFDVPLKINIDFSDPVVKSLSGGMIILNTTDFALILPYDDEAKSIVVYNPRMYEVLSVPLIEEQFVQKKSFLGVLLLILLLVILVYILYRHYKSKGRLPAKNLREN